jgi:hypothetical protein
MRCPLTLTPYNLMVSTTDEDDAALALFDDKLPESYEEPYIATFSSPPLFQTRSPRSTNKEPTCSTNQFIPGQAEPVVVGSIQPLSFLTVEEYTPPDLNLPPPFEAYYNNTNKDDESDMELDPLLKEDSLLDVIDSDDASDQVSDHSCSPKAKIHQPLCCGQM